jgi:hypothetical protein
VGGYASSTGGRCDLLPCAVDAPENSIVDWTDIGVQWLQGVKGVYYENVILKIGLGRWITKGIGLDFDTWLPVSRDPGYDVQLRLTVNVFLDELDL